MAFDLEAVQYSLVIFRGDETTPTVPPPAERNAAIAAAEEGLKAAQEAQVAALYAAKEANTTYETALATVEAAEATLRELGGGIEHLEVQLEGARKEVAEWGPRVEEAEKAADAAADAVEEAEENVQHTKAIPLGVVREDSLPRPYRIVRPVDPIAHNSCPSRLSLWLNDHNVVISADYS